MVPVLFPSRSRIQTQTHLYLDVFVGRVATDSHAYQHNDRVNDKIVQVGYVQAQDASRVTLELKNQPRPVMLTFQTQITLETIRSKENEEA